MSRLPRKGCERGCRPATARPATPAAYHWSSWLAQGSIVRSSNWFRQDDARSRAHELSLQTLPTFFSVLELLLRAGVATVAEAAFRDRLWRPGLEPCSLARIRIVHCMVDAEGAFRRSLQRSRENPLRLAHADPGPQDAADYVLRQRAFDRVSVDAPWIEVDTTFATALALQGASGP